MKKFLSYIFILTIIFFSSGIAAKKSLGSHLLLINEKGYRLPLLTHRSGAIIAFNTPVKIYGSLHSSIFALGSGVIINNSVKKNIITCFSNIRINKNAKVNGSAISIGGRVVIEEGAKVKGLAVAVFKNKLKFKNLFYKPFLYLSLLFLGLFLNFFFLNNFIYLAEGLKLKFFEYLFYGLLVFPAVGLLFLVLLGTVIGTLILPVLVFISTFMLFFAVYSVSLFIGEKIVKLFSFKDYPYFEQLIGITALFFISMIPVIGKLLVILMIITGLGTTIKNKFGVR